MKKLYLLNNFLVIEVDGIKNLFPLTHSYPRVVEKSYFITHKELEIQLKVDGSDSIDSTETQFNENTLLSFLTNNLSAY